MSHANKAFFNFNLGERERHRERVGERETDIERTEGENEMCDRWIELGGGGERTRDKSE